MAKKKEKEETKEEFKEETAPKKEAEKKETAKKKADKKEKIPLIKLFNEAKYRQSQMLGAFDFGGLLDEFTDDLVKGTENCKLTVDEFEEMIKNYRNRRL